MKGLILAIALMASAAASAGVSGDKIHFQSISTWVSAVYSKSLCLNGDTYEAIVNKCVEWRHGGDDDRCVRTVKAKAFQPMNSTRKVCARWTGRDDSNCVEYKVVPYVQKRVRTVTFTRDNDSDTPIRTQKVVIPDCK